MIRCKLTFLLTVLLIATSIPSYCQTQLNTPDFLDSLHSVQPLLIDVRTKKEFEQGTISDAKNVDWNQDEAFRDYVSKLNKSQPIYLFCLSGGRSKKASEYLSSQGFRVFELKGGYLKYQQDRILPDKTTNPSDDEISFSSFEETIKSTPKALVVFKADWCPPCKLMNPFLHEIQQDSTNGINVVFIDVDRNKYLLQTLHLSSIPYLHYYKKGELMWQHSGIIEKSTLLQAIQDL